MAALTDKQRTRVAAIVTWDDSINPERLARHVEAAHCQAARSPLHDRDAYTAYDLIGFYTRNADRLGPLGSTIPDDELQICDWVMTHWDALTALLDPDMPVQVGNLKKPHYHWLLAFRGSKTAQQIRDLLFLPDGYHIEKVEDKGGYLRYLCHLDSPEKERYEVGEIQSFGGLDLSPLVQINELSRMDYTNQVIDFIYENRLHSFNRLVEWARNSGDFQLQDIVVKRAPFWIALISSYGNDRAKERRALGQTPEALADFEAGMYADVV